MILKIFLIMFVLLGNATSMDYLGIQFPYDQLGSCYDSVKSLGSYYEGQGRTVTYLYSPSQDHVWLLVDQQQVDIYWGKVPNGTWKPEFSYPTYDEFQEGVKEQTGFNKI